MVAIRFSQGSPFSLALDKDDLDRERKEKDQKGVTKCLSESIFYSVVQLILLNFFQKGLTVYSQQIGSLGAIAPGFFQDRIDMVFFHFQ